MSYTKEMIFIPTPFFKKGRGYCNRLRPSLPRLFDKIQSNLVVSYSNEWGVQNHNCLASPPVILGKRPKGQISLNFNYKVNFKAFFTFQLQSQIQRFLYQTLCVFSQMKDRKHIEPNFHFVSCVMPKEWDLGCLGQNL